MSRVYQTYWKPYRTYLTWLRFNRCDQRNSGRRFSPSYLWMSRFGFSIRLPWMMQRLSFRNLSVSTKSHLFPVPPLGRLTCVIFSCTQWSSTNCSLDCSPLSISVSSSSLVSWRSMPKHTSSWCGSCSTKPCKLKYNLIFLVNLYYSYIDSLSRNIHTYTVLV
jgi:hypothetical protein